MSSRVIHLGYEVGTGDPVTVPLRHMAVTGQTQQSGKTTTLEALATRSGVTTLSFLTKRGETSFANSAKVRPYFRDRADWQFVTTLLDATLREKNKFLRPWIMKICRSTKTLADVQIEVRKALKKAKGINEGVYTQLDAYLDLIVPEIKRSHLAADLRLHPGVNAMDVGTFQTSMQMLFLQSAIDYINEHRTNVVTIVPEAWEFIPEGKGSPVKDSAVTLVRKGAGIGNYIWVDSQDMAGVDKVILRGCTVWLIGVQREANEIKRNLSNIPAHMKKPKAGDIAQLQKGQFFACWDNHLIKTYVQPVWMPFEEARGIARGELKLKANPPKSLTSVFTSPSIPAPEPDLSEDDMATLASLETKFDKLLDLLGQRTGLDRHTSTPEDHPLSNPEPEEAARPYTNDGVLSESLYQAIKARLLEDAKKDPKILKILTVKPAIDVVVEHKTIEIDGATIRGTLAKLMARGWFDEKRRGTDAVLELARLGIKAARPGVYSELDNFTKMGFLTKDDGEGKGYTIVPDMKVNIIHKR